MDLHTPANRLRGRRIVLTGAASGIGRATARLFVQEGALVALLDRDEGGLGEIANEIGGRPVAADVTDEDAVSRAVGEAAAALSGIDGVVNAAGIMCASPIADVPVATWRRVLEVNLTGTYIV